MKDPVKLIKDDHRHVKGLFRRFERASRKSQKQEIAGEIVEELSRHAAVEEQLIYPLLRKVDRSLEKDILHALEEHHMAALVLLEIDKMGPDDERFEAKMGVLKEAIQEHIEDEESDLLPRLARMLDKEHAAKLARAILELKAKAPNHPHPTSPMMPGNPLTGVVAKVSDAGKDLVRKVTDRDRTRAHDKVRQRVKREAAAARPRSGGVMRQRRSRPSPTHR
ncbi:MAG TPA: hemerythrin domain-containing protein [Kofleriaceae bacterium]|jgi:hemerythrin superfamily protein|nr:hemerythrin domain-containing protein [Kofleriaceae bacterium]